MNLSCFVQQDVNGGGGLQPAVIKKKGKKTKNRTTRSWQTNDLRENVVKLLPKHTEKKRKTTGETGVERLNLVSGDRRLWYQFCFSSTRCSRIPAK